MKYLFSLGLFFSLGIGQVSGPDLTAPDNGATEIDETFLQPLFLMMALLGMFPLLARMIMMEVKPILLQLSSMGLIQAVKVILF